MQVVSYYYYTPPVWPLSVFSLARAPSVIGNKCVQYLTTRTTKPLFRSIMRMIVRQQVEMSPLVVFTFILTSRVSLDLIQHTHTPKSWRLLLLEWNIKLYKYRMISFHSYFPVKQEKCVQKKKQTNACFKMQLCHSK